MPAQKFEYDESGSTFFYFVISVLGLILVPCTFIFFPSDEVEEVNKQKKLTCKCSDCLAKKDRLKNGKSDWKKTKKLLQRIFIVLGWILMAILINKVQQFDYESANFDPYDILGVGHGSSAGDIKKAYRKASLVLHPDKPTGDEKKFMKLNKAYQALTDDTARRNYEQYGNPDGPQNINFGIALPSWIVQKENSLWVLGVYTLVVMFGVPTVVGVWWYRSSKFTADQVLLDTTQLYYYFIHKTPSMNFKRALMVLASSFEFEKEHNSAVEMRASDNLEVPLLFKHLPLLQPQNRERPLCMLFSVKARALLHAHLSRLPLNPQTLDKDRLYVLHCCPTLITEMVNCCSQLIMLAHAGRISHLPTLDTVEAIMKMGPTIIQALWETKSALLQLPHLTEAKLRHCVVRGRSIRSIQQFVALNKADRHQMLKNFTPEEQHDIIQVCLSFPKISMSVKHEVVDDDDTGVFTAGAIVTITVKLTRTSCGEYYPGLVTSDPFASVEAKGEAEEKREVKEASAKVSEEDMLMMQLKSRKDTKWSKAKKDKNVKPVSAKAAKKTAAKLAKKEEQAASEAAKEEKKKKKEEEEKKDQAEANGSAVEDIEGDSSDEGSESHSDESDAEDADSESQEKTQQTEEEDEDAEWERFQKGLVKKEKKALEGKSKISHLVHCPFFTDEKQEFWWIYVCDRKRGRLISVPYQITDLVKEEEVTLKMTAPDKPGAYTFQVVLRSDSYIGLEEHRDIRLDVKKAREVPTQHPQWDECDSTESESESGGGESEYTTDEESDSEEEEE